MNRGLSVYKTRLHDIERPIAMLSSMHANSNRNAKKRPEPYNYLDFSFYKPQVAGETPDGANGAAYMELVRLKKLPPWALFCFKELSTHAAKGYVPDEPAFIAEDAILLHPESCAGGFKGLLVALESSSDKRRVFTKGDGTTVTLQVPYIDTKMIAREGEFLSR